MHPLFAPAKWVIEEDTLSVRPPRILAPPPATSPVDVLEYEVMQEKAATLGRLTKAFEQALAALRAFDTEAARNGALDGGAEREELLDAAAEALWNFVVQREVCGLRNTEAVLREYAVPAALRLRMGVARRR